jgi:putative sterol carrier protein
MSDNGAEAIDATSGAESIDTSAVDPEEFARTIGKTPDDQLREAMQGPMRDQIIGEIFKRMEEHYRGGGQAAVIHWAITGRADGSEDLWEAVVTDGSCSTRPNPTSEPRVTLRMDGVNFLKLVSGNASGPMMFMSGKLKIEGDLMFSAQIQSMFTIPDGS